MQPICDIAKDIDSYADCICKLGMTYHHLNIRMYASLFLNFRDALTHYIGLYDANVNSDNDEMIKQGTAIGEHLSRGIKDGCVSILHEMRERTGTALKKAYIKEEKSDFRKQMHEYKKMEIEIRRGIKLKDISHLFKFVDKLINTIRNTENVFMKYNVYFKANANRRLPPI